MNTLNDTDKKAYLKKPMIQNGGELQIEANCREFFTDKGECPKSRYMTGGCPLNIYPIKGNKYCCMKKQGIKGGLAFQGDEHESSI